MTSAYMTYRIAKMMAACLSSMLMFMQSSTAQVERIWLTSKSNQLDKVVVNWETTKPGNSVVNYGTTEKYGNTVIVEGSTTLHHVEIPIDTEVPEYHYRVSTGGEESSNNTFKIPSNKELRVAIVANWHRRPNLDAVLKDSIHLLMTAGDNITDLHSHCGAGVKDCTKAYRPLIDTYPKLFPSVIFMPVLGNHDREIRPRGKEPPNNPVYDIEATAYRQFFALPNDGWKWYIDIPKFDVRFVALDFNHITDQGTTWQSCHPFGRGSQQFEWYRSIMTKNDKNYVITLHNEKNDRTRQQVDGEWHRMFQQGTAVITGYGHFAERAEEDKTQYFNTSLNGKGNKFPDKDSRFFESQDNYILITIFRNTSTMRSELKSLNGDVLEQFEWIEND
ncbi:MAG: hypothetical protein DHS20C17_00900 [Cyclobacteriaceae bacterium]|nr:MAG: hypothetical protein DHS20C17_00900 [Cyclobacteriaceae bacterium]